MQPSSEPHKYGCDILNVVLFSFVFRAFYGFCLFSVTVWIEQQITHTKTWTTDFTFAARFFFILSLDRMSIFRRNEWPQNCLLRQFDVILIVFLWFMSVLAVLRPWLTESNHLFLCVSVRPFWLWCYHDFVRFKFHDFWVWIRHTNISALPFCYGLTRYRFDSQHR